MATKKKSTGIVLKDGQYYTALVNRKKIRGKVWEDSDGDFYLLNNQGVGDSACDFDDDCDFSYGLFIELTDEYGDVIDSAVEQEFKSQHINQFTVVTDKRIKKIIDSDILPETAGWKVRKNKDGEYEFGCGAVTLSKAEIEEAIKIEKERRTLAERLEDIEEGRASKAWEKVNNDYNGNASGTFSDFDLSEAEELLKY